MAVRAIAGCVFVLAGGVAQAQTFTFEDPNFTLLERTPFTNRASDTDPTTTASFLVTADTLGGSGTPDAFQIGSNGIPGDPTTPIFSPSFSNQILIENQNNAANDILTVELNKAFGGLSVDFALSDPGQFTAVTGAGQTFSAAGVLDPNTTLYVGTLSFSGLAFSTVDLSASALTGTIFAIDNLSLTPGTVPEPGTVALALGALTPLAVQWRRRKNR